MEPDRPSEIPSALLAGRLQGISLPDLLWALCHCKSTGVLRLTRDEIEKSVYVESGRIVFAASSDPDDRLGELFLRGGMITLDELDGALSGLHTGKRLGTLLVEAGALNPEELTQGVLTQVESIVLGLFDWENGDYRFEEGPLPTEELITLSMRTGELLLGGIRQLQSFSRIRRSVGATQKTYGLTENWREPLDGIVLTAGEESLLERLSESDVTVEELCREVFLSNFEIYQTIWGLKVLGVVEERDEPWIAPSDVTHKGSLAQVDFTELLVRLGRGGETGVLYVTSGEYERSFHISAGRCGFATSNDPDDGLLAYLLRRGVISLRDREETSKRLLSNKRVGTILRELGVIDEQDLEEMVREQLSEIVYDTFRWTDAEYAFAPGELPTVEEITLEEDLDALVARGIRRVSSWSRVWHGCGGLEVILELKPTYLSVLDAMGAGPDEWQVIAALKTPRTPREICRSVTLDDFRTCQILWAMRALGGLEAVAAVDEVPIERPAEVDGPEYVDAGAHRGVEPDPEPLERFDEPVAGSMAVAELDMPGPVDEPDYESTAVAELDMPGPVDEPDYESMAVAELDMPGPVDEPDYESTAVAELDMPGPVDEPDYESMAVAELDYPQSSVEPSVDATQAIPRDVIDAALGESDSAADEHKPSPDATQVIPRDVVEAAVAGEETEPAQAAAPLEEAGDLATESEVGTLKLVRESVDDALRFEAPAEPIDESEASAPSADPDWQAPQDMDRVIARFNAAQRVVYRTVRAEIGAGAANFIRACCAQLAEEESDPVAGVTMQADGSWDSEGLRRTIRAWQVADPWALYQKLIGREIEMLRQLVGESRATELARQIETVEQADSARPS